MLIEPSLNDPYKALCVIDRATRCKWQVIRSFIMKWGCQSCALAAASSSALGRNRRKTTHTSTLIWAMLGRSSAPIVQRYSVSIRAWVHTKLIRQIVLTVRWIELKGSSAASLVMRCPAANQLQVPSSPQSRGGSTRPKKRITISGHVSDWTTILGRWYGTWCCSLCRADTHYARP